jgi:oxygen-dependent protoporphyrinogen oxidase
MKVAVVGGGVTGLAAAYRLQSLGFEPTVYEAAPRVGGVAWTERQDGFLAETGPNSLAAPKPAAAALLSELGLAERLLEASPAGRRRYIVRDGRLVPLPLSPIELLTSAALSPKAKLGLLREPFVPASRCRFVTRCRDCMRWNRITAPCLPVWWRRHERRGAGERPG